MDNNINNRENNYNSKLNPWFSMWLQPRNTIRQILDSGVYGPVMGLAAVAGIADSFSRVGERNLSMDSSLLSIILVAVIGGAIGGVIGLYIWSALIKWTGKWIGGQANYDEIVAAAAWANVPIIWSLVLWTIAIVLFGKDAFYNHIFIYNSFAFGVSWIFSILFFIIGVWSIFTNLKCIAEAQRFSAWMALANCILAGLIIIVPILIIVVISASLYF